MDRLESFFKSTYMYFYSRYTLDHFFFLFSGNILMLEDVVQNTTDDDIHTEFVQSYDNSEMTSPKSSKENNHTVDVKPKSPFVEPLSQYDDANTSDSVCSHISDSGEPKLVLIDFEYCAYNYRGFDIANHFQEWSYDYTNPEPPFYFENQENCPTIEQKVGGPFFLFCFS